MIIWVTGFSLTAQKLIILRILANLNTRGEWLFTMSQNMQIWGQIKFSLDCLDYGFHLRFEKLDENY